jgi:hypothetical protein
MAIQQQPELSSPLHSRDYTDGTTYPKSGPSLKGHRQRPAAIQHYESHFLGVVWQAAHTLTLWCNPSSSKNKQDYVRKEVLAGVFTLRRTACPGECDVESISIDPLVLLGTLTEPAVMNNVPQRR